MLSGQQPRHGETTLAPLQLRSRRDRRARRRIPRASSAPISPKSSVEPVDIVIERRNQSQPSLAKNSPDTSKK